ncbi:glutathione peroxidase [Xylanibacillus composti]|uniref:Glutathione peroxidase n=1 Tax=Xylanibacillus composti TaxID=1572762 RepID=A0A8J4H8S0_9BACL|nr:glutathione peroxidase [Xylanibacillus composti]MDT9726635.1 glutathione peroxidase [Xylanibacillus composti]GIQ70803.1 glutathione peroxidase [Xylanibacillus composti]
MQTVYDFKVKLPSGEEQSLRAYEGKALLIVNTASKCGFTPQFKGLQELYETYRDQGLEILAFPCDQFNNQEFSSIEETTQFCQIHYGVTFPVFAKIDVNGDQADPLFVFLKEQQRGVLTKSIKWNFTKFLIDRKGQVVKRYAPTTVPAQIEPELQDLLNASQ